jgi:MYXO-CTERM domain-containing protein
VASAASQSPPPPTVSQVVSHNLGDRPKALILWMVNQRTAGLSVSIGLSDGPGSSLAFSAASPDGEPRSTASRRLAAHALTVIQGQQVVVADADVTTWDVSSFSLRWSPDRPLSGTVHYLAIGGAGVSAKLIRWEAPASPGDTPIDGVGFSPSAVIHLYGGAAVGTDPPVNEDDALIGIGVMDRNGGQWANQIFSLAHNLPSLSLRMHAGDACIYMFNDMGLTRRATFRAMNRDGFSVDFTVSGQGSTLRTQIASLALAGIQATAGAVDKSVAPAPATQVVTGIGFRPGSVLLSGVQEVHRLSPSPESRFGFGAADSVDEASVAVWDATGVSPTSSAAVERSDRLFVKLDNNLGGGAAEATLSALTADGFALSWSPNDGVASQIGYLALGPGTANPDAAPDAFPDAPADAPNDTAPADRSFPADAADVPPTLDDAGAVPDSPTARPVALQVGCACQTTPSPHARLWILLLLAWALLARVHRRER